MVSLPYLWLTKRKSFSYLRVLKSFFSKNMDPLLADIDPSVAEGDEEQSGACYRCRDDIEHFRLKVRVSLYPNSPRNQFIFICNGSGEKSGEYIQFFGDYHRRRRRTFESGQQFGQRAVDRQCNFGLARETFQSPRGDFLPKSQRRRFPGTYFLKKVGLAEYLMSLLFAGKCAEKEVFQRCARSQKTSQNAFTTHFYLLRWRTL